MRQLLLSLLIVWGAGCVPSGGSSPPIDGRVRPPASGIAGVVEQANKGQREAWRRLALDVASRTKTGELKDEAAQAAFWSEGIKQISEQKSAVIGNALNGQSWTGGKFDANKSETVWKQVAEGIGR